MSDSNSALTSSENSPVRYKLFWIYSEGHKFVYGNSLPFGHESQGYKQSSFSDLLGIRAKHIASIDKCDLVSSFYSINI